MRKPELVDPRRSLLHASRRLRRWRRVPFEHGDVMAVAGEQQRARQPDDTPSAITTILLMSGR